MQSLFNFALIFSFIACVINALHIEVPAVPRPEPVCIRDFVQENQMVVVNINTDGYKGDGQRLDLTIVDSVGNLYATRKDIVGKIKIAFTS